MVLYFLTGLLYVHWGFSTTSSRQNKLVDNTHAEWVDVCVLVMQPMELFERFKNNNNKR